MESNFSLKLKFPEKRNDYRKWAAFIPVFQQKYFSFTRNRVSDICGYVAKGNESATAEEILSYFITDKLWGKYDIWLDYYYRGILEGELYRAIVNHCIDLARANNSKPRFKNIDDYYKLFIENSTDQRKEQNEFEEEMLSYLKVTYPAGYDVFYQKYFLGEENKVIAKNLTLSDTNVSTRLSRAKSILRSKFGNRNK